MKTAFILIVSLSIVAFNCDAFLADLKDPIELIETYYRDAILYHRYDTCYEGLENLLEEIRQEQPGVITDKKYKSYKQLIKLNVGEKRLAELVLHNLRLEAHKYAINDLNLFVQRDYKGDYNQEKNGFLHLLRIIKETGVVCKDQDGKYKSDVEGAYKGKLKDLAKIVRSYIRLKAIIEAVEGLLNFQCIYGAIDFGKQLKQWLNHSIASGIISQQRVDNLETITGDDTLVLADFFLKFLKAKQNPGGGK